MISKLGHWLLHIHDGLRQNKDRIFEPLVRILPKKISPNQVTLFRFIIVLIWLPFALFKPALWQVVLYFIIYFFDLLDGAVARLKNQTTYLGKYFDAFADRLNHIVLWLVVLAVTNYQIITVKIFIGWEVLIALFIVIEYFLKKEKCSYIRTLIQFCVKIILWALLIQEVVQVYF